MIKSQELTQSCLTTFTPGIIDDTTKMCTKYPMYLYLPRFLKADATSGNFGVKTIDILLTHPTWVTEQRHRSFGKCYTIHPDEKTRCVLCFTR